MTERENQEPRNQEDSAAAAGEEQTTPGLGARQERAQISITPASVDEDSSISEQVTHVDLTMDLATGTRLRVTVEALPAPGETSDDNDVIASQTIISNGEPISVTLSETPSASTVDQVPQITKGQAALVGFWERLLSTLKRWPYSLESTLFGLALLVYLSTRLIGLLDFPIYFFTDEAAQTVLAADLVRDNFKNEDKTFLPTYFKNGGQYNLSVSVYAQVIPYLLFGKSDFCHSLGRCADYNAGGVKCWPDAQGYLQDSLLVERRAAALSSASLVPALAHSLRNRYFRITLRCHAVCLPALPLPLA